MKITLAWYTPLVLRGIQLQVNWQMWWRIDPTEPMDASGSCILFTVTASQHYKFFDFCFFFFINYQYLICKISKREVFGKCLIHRSGLLRTAWFPWRRRAGLLWWIMEFPHILDNAGAPYSRKFMSVSIPKWNNDLFRCCWICNSRHLHSASSPLTELYCQRSTFIFPIFIEIKDSFCPKTRNNCHIFSLFP